MGLLKLTLVAALGVLLATAAACGDDDDDDDGGGDPEVGETAGADSEGSEDDPAEDGEGGDETSVSSIGDAGFPTEYTIEGPPTASNSASLDTSVLLNLQHTAEPEEEGRPGIPTFLVRAPVNATEGGSVECGGTTHDGPFTTNLDSGGGDPIGGGVLQISTDGIVDVLVHSAVGALNSAEGFDPVCFEISGAYTGGTQVLEGAGGNFTIRFVDGVTTITVD
ncbi:MAG: hypothetical protein GEU28_01420 [Dehalococcoidia bacterium]|nr:hypothetical protein [Dehalococcoidia bacterium]